MYSCWHCPSRHVCVWALCISTLVQLHPSLRDTFKGSAGVQTHHQTILHRQTHCNKLSQGIRMDISLLKFANLLSRSILMSVCAHAYHCAHSWTFSPAGHHTHLHGQDLVQDVHSNSMEGRAPSRILGCCASITILYPPLFPPTLHRLGSLF